MVMEEMYYVIIVDLMLPGKIGLNYKYNFCL